MIASIISTGNEVLIGDITDTNSSFLAGQLTEMGVFVKNILAVRDDIDDIAQAITESASKSDICLITGGLGPTSDDVTALGCAKACKVNLSFNEAAFDHMKEYFDRRGFQMTPENKKQAMLPEFCIPLMNDHGTAPGFSVKLENCRLYFMPGVPAEMKQMFKERVVPDLNKWGENTNQITIDRLTVFGLGESKVGAMLAGFEEKFSMFSLGFRAAYPLIEVKIVSEGTLDARTADQMKSARDWVVQRLEGKVVSLQGLGMAEEVGRLLTLHKKTVAVAESCTGGLIANWLTDVSGSSDYFLFSGVTYSNEAKMQVLGVKPETIVAHGAVHEQTACEMAAGARIKAKADYGISTTGVAGPTGGTAEKPVGMVCIGLAGSDFVSAKTYYFTSGNRLMNKQIFAATALNQLRRHLVSVFETF